MSPKAATVVVAVAEAAIEIQAFGGTTMQPPKSMKAF
jgi:hypothetical protein